MTNSTDRKNAREVVVEVNGQQEELIKKLVASDPSARGAEELIKQGFVEFAKSKRSSR